MTEPTIYELSVPGRCGVTMPAPDVPEAELPAALLRDELGLPSCRSSTWCGITCTSRS